MHKNEFIYKDNKTLFSISQNKDFADHEDNIHNYDYVYRIVDISGNLISEVDKFQADGYGFGTVVKMSAKHLEQLDKNIRKMVTNAINGDSLSEGLLVSEKDNSTGIKVQFEQDGIDFVVLVKVVKDDAYVIIFDSMPVYLNYHFLFASIHDFNGADMFLSELQEENIEDKKNNFYFYYGDENTDTQFDSWLEEQSPKIHKVFRKLGITKEYSDE